MDIPAIGPSDSRHPDSGPLGLTPRIVAPAITRMSCKETFLLQCIDSGVNTDAKKLLLKKIKICYCHVREQNWRLCSANARGNYGSNYLAATAGRNFLTDFVEYGQTARLRDVHLFE